MGSKTPLYDKHVEAGARIVDFGGWDMPLNYGSQKEEHHAVRQKAGMFDVSHMTIVDLKGERTREFLRYLVANDVAKLRDTGKALYTAMLNDDGGVIDDLIIYFMTEDWFRLVVNAATRKKDLAWIRQQAEAWDVSVSERAELAMVAVQGPEARQLAAPCIDVEYRDAALGLKPFFGMEAGDMFVARTGYTGEDGWEIVMLAADAPGVWDRLQAAGVAPCGLAARDTLRLEAAMNLYGSDMRQGSAGRLPGSLWIVISSAAKRSRRSAPTRTKCASSGCCSKTKACCETTNASSSRASAKAKSPAAVTRRRLAVRSPWLAFRPVTTTARRWTCAANY